MEPSAAVGRAGLVALVALSVLALVARLLGTGAGLPHLVEPDNAYFLQPRLIADGGAEARAHHDYGRYPHLVSRILMQWPERELGEGSLDDHLRQAAAPSWRPRVLIAVAGAACVPATFLLARQFLGVGWSLFAAALLGSSVLHQLFSAQGRPHVAVTLFMTCTIWASLRLLRRGNWSDYALAGLFAALALGSLHNGIAALLPLGMAHVLRSRGLGRSEHAKLLAPLLLVAASAVAFLGFLFQSQPENAASAQLQGQAVGIGSHAFHFDEIHGRGFRVIAWTLWSYEPILLALLAIALLLLVRRLLQPRVVDAAARARALVLAAFVLPYVVAIGLYDATYERFVIPLLPGLALCAAWGISTLVDFAHAGRPRRALGMALALAALAWPGWAALRLTRLCASPDTATRAARWLRENADPRAERILLTTQLDLPLLREPTTTPPFAPQDRRLGAWVYPWTYYQLGLAQDSRLGPVWRVGWLPTTEPAFVLDLRDRGPAALAELDWTLVVEGSFTDGWIPGNQRRIHDALGTLGERVASFAPYADEGMPRALWWQESGRVARPFWSRLLDASSFGPAIEIYRRR